MKQTTTGATPKPFPMPYLLFQNFIHAFWQLPNGMVQKLTKDERPQIITKQDYESYVAIFNR